MISQMFILSGRGDTIVSKDYRGDVVKGTAEIFFRKLKSWPVGEAPPIFNVEGIHFIYIRRNSLYFVCTTKFNVQPASALELLTRISALCKDYCGVLTEESIRVNFVLVYELLDEVIDFGYGQTTSTETLKAYVYNEPVAVVGGDSGGFLGRNKSVPSSASNKPIALRFQDHRDRKNEIFLDLLERLTVLFGPNGNVLRAEIDGCIQMKTFLQGTPDLSLGLNEDIVIGNTRGVYGRVLDDCNFHECVNLDQFENSKILVMRPPDGEFTVMNYRITSGFAGALPFRVSIATEDVPVTGRTDINVKLDCEVTNKTHGANVIVRIPLPRGTSSCGYELGGAGQTVEYKKDEKVAIWKIAKAQGGASFYCRLKIMTPEEDARHVRADLGNISMEFEVPMYVCSGLNIRFLRVTERGKDYVPFRWVRYITHRYKYLLENDYFSALFLCMLTLCSFSDSYVIRT